MVSATSRPLGSAARRSPGLLLNTSALPRGLVLDLVLIGPILLLALAMRTINLGAYSGLFDEGIRTEQLFLMSQGYRPFREIYAAQGLRRFWLCTGYKGQLIEEYVNSREWPATQATVRRAG